MEPTSSSAVPPDALLAHAGFMRGLAFAILRDDADADDATQEALVAGLASGPRDPAAARSWLAAVVRNVAYRFRRRAARSDARERRASRAEASASTLDAVAREETLRAVVDAIGRLDPASREVVLLRNYDGLPPREIATRLGLPVETVKKRIARAHATLRARLVSGEGASDRRRALAAFAGFPLGSRGGTVAAAAGGGVAMASGMKWGLAAAAALLVAGGSVWVVADRDDDGGAAPAAPKPVAVAVAPAPDARAEGVEAPLAASGRETRSPAAPAAAAKARALPNGWSRHAWGGLSLALPDAWSLVKGHDPEMQTWEAEGRDGRPVGAFGLASGKAAETVRAKLPEERVTRAVTVLGEAATWTEARRPGKDGQDAMVGVIVSFDAPTATTPGFHFVAMAPASRWAEHAKAFEDVLSFLERDRTPPGPAPTSDGEPDSMQLAAWGGIVPGDRVEGRVVRGTRGVPGATVRLVRASIVAAADGRETADVVGETTTADEGVFSFTGLAPGMFEVVVSAPDVSERRVVAETRALPGTTTRVVVVLGTATIDGRGFARDGAPAAGQTAVLTSVRAPGAPTSASVVLDRNGRFRASGLSSGVWAIRLALDDDPNGDHRDAAVDTSSRQVSTVVLGSDVPEPVWEGTARLASGTPLFDGLAGLDVASAKRTAQPTYVSVRTDARGAFARRLPVGTYNVLLRGVPHVSMFTFELEVGAGGLRRDVLVPGVLVTGTLVDGDTRRPFPPARPGMGPGVCIFAASESIPTSPALFPPDEHGTFRLFGVPPGRYVVYARPAPGDDRVGSSVEVDVPADRDATGLVLGIHAR